MNDFTEERPAITAGANQASTNSQQSAQQKARTLLAKLQKALSGVVQTRPETLQRVIITLLCRGHLLIEDVPGTGKTTLARALSQALAVRMKRIQCTPDLMPSDITGVSVYNSEDHKFHFIPGPVFSNILLADEINRATPRTQSALLEAMGEGTVTCDRKTYPLPDPFFVIATQNPVAFSGTFPLPEAQADRFMMRLSLGYPNAAQEVAMMMAQLTGHPLDGVSPVLSEGHIKALQKQITSVTLSKGMAQYIQAIVEATRNHPSIKLGCSPRGSLALMHTARAAAFIQAQDHVTPDIVRSLLEPVLAHRMVFRDSALNDEEQRRSFWKALLEGIPVPDQADTSPTPYF